MTSLPFTNLHFGNVFSRRSQKFRHFWNKCFQKWDQNYLIYPFSIDICFSENNDQGLICTPTPSETIVA